MERSQRAAVRKRDLAGRLIRPRPPFFLHRKRETDPGVDLASTALGQGHLQDALVLPTESDRAVAVEGVCVFWERADPVPDVGRWLAAVVGGHMRYCGVPMNSAALRLFRFQVGNLWYRALCRRSQIGRGLWDRMRQLIDRWLPRPVSATPIL
jgi:hypothetical protein